MLKNYIQLLNTFYYIGKLHILIKQFNKIRHDSIILLEQIRLLDKVRLKGYLGLLDSKTMKKVNETIKISFEVENSTFFNVINKEFVHKVKKEDNL